VTKSLARETVCAVAAGLLALSIGGCTVSNSLSDSVGSISGSVSGMSDSTSNSLSRSSDSSRSGGADADAEAFQRDVTVYTAVFVESGASRAGFIDDLTRIAAGHGISEWWADPATYRAIGLGLKRGGLDEADVSSFAHDVFGDNARAAEELLDGHRS